MVSLSRQLTLLTQGVKLKTAKDRRSAAQALAVALALDPANNGAREILSTLRDGKNLDRPKEESVDAAKRRIWQVFAWLSMPQAGSDGNILAALIGDPVSVLDRDRPDAANAGGSKEQGEWQGWVAPLSAFEENTIAKKDPPTEVEPEKPSKNPASNAAVVLEEAELKTVLHTYDRELNIWSFGLSTVNMKASRKSPDFGSNSKRRGENRRRKKFGILVPSSPSDRSRIESMVVEPIMETLSDYRSELPDQGQIRLLVNGGNYSFRKNLTYLTGPGFILANAALSGAEPYGTVIAELDKDQKMAVPPYFWQLLTALSKQKAGRLIVPPGAEEYLINLLVLKKPEFFLENEVLIASSTKEFVALCAKTPTKERAAALKKFGEIAAKSEGNPVDLYLANSFVQQRLEEIVAEAPYHLSAKLLVMQASSVLPRYLSRKVLAAEVWQVVEPLNALTNVDLKDTNTAKLEALYDKMRESIGNLERYADLRDRELVNDAKELPSKIRSFTRALRGRGDFDDRYDEIYSARNEMIRKNSELRQKLSQASGDPLPEELERK